MSDSDDSMGLYDPPDARPPPVGLGKAQESGTAPQSAAESNRLRDMPFGQKINSPLHTPQLTSASSRASLPSQSRLFQPPFRGTHGEQADGEPDKENEDRMQLDNEANAPAPDLIPYSGFGIDPSPDQHHPVDPRILGFPLRSAASHPVARKNLEAIIGHQGSNSTDAGRWRKHMHTNFPGLKHGRSALQQASGPGQAALRTGNGFLNNANTNSTNFSFNRDQQKNQIHSYRPQPVNIQRTPFPHPPAPQSLPPPSLAPGLNPVPKLAAAHAELTHSLKHFAMEITILEFQAIDLDLSPSALASFVGKIEALKTQAANAFPAFPIDYLEPARLEWAEHWAHWPGGTGELDTSGRAEKGGQFVFVGEHGKTLGRYEVAAKVRSEYEGVRDRVVAHTSSQNTASKNTSSQIPMPDSRVSLGIGMKSHLESTTIPPCPQSSAPQAQVPPAPAAPTRPSKPQTAWSARLRSINASESAVTYAEDENGAKEKKKKKKEDKAQPAADATVKNHAQTQLTARPRRPGAWVSGGPWRGRMLGQSRVDKWYEGR